MFTATENCPAPAELTEPIYSTLATDPEMAELVALFVDELTSRVAAIHRAAADEDWTQVRVLAHQLKGAGGSYGFPQITAAAAILERACKEQLIGGERDSAIEQFAAVCGLVRAGRSPA